MQQVPFLKVTDKHASNKKGIDNTKTQYLGTF